MAYLFRECRIKRTSFLLPQAVRLIEEQKCEVLSTVSDEQTVTTTVRERRTTCMLSTAQSPTMAPLQFSCNSCVAKVAVLPANAGTVEQASTKKGYIANCRHIFCENCRAKFTDKCVLCGKQCKVLELAQQLPRNIRSNFEPIDQLYGEYENALKFQLDQLAIRDSNLRGINAHHQKKFNEEKARYRMDHQKCFANKETKIKAQTLIKHLVNLR